MQPSYFERRASSGGISFQRNDEIPYGQALLACAPKAASVLVSTATADTLEEHDDDTLWAAIARHGAQSSTAVMVMLPSFGGDRSLHAVPPTLSGLAAGAAQRATVFLPHSDEPGEDDGETYVSEDWLDYIRNTPTYYQKFLAERAPQIRWLDELAATLVAQLAATAVVDHESPLRTGLTVQRRGKEWAVVLNERGGRVARIVYGVRDGANVPVVLVANESDRTAAIAAFAAAGITQPFDPTPGWLNATVQPGDHGWLDVVWHGTLASHSVAADLASMRLHDNELTVFAPTLRTPIEGLMRRVGYPTTTVRIDAPPGDPYRLFGFDLVDALESPEFPQQTPRILRPHARQQLPEQWADILQTAWTPTVGPAEPPVPQDMFTTRERFRISLTPPEKLLTADAVCRLCDQPSNHYCHACRKDATHGIFIDWAFPEFRRLH